MARFFGRRRAPAPPTPGPPEADPADSPEALRQNLAQLIRFINRSAGRLPGVAVVRARRVTDLLQAIIDTTDTRPLEIHALLSLKGIVNDYLPTTLRSFLAVDERTVGTGNPTRLLVEQLDILHTSAERVLGAVRTMPRGEAENVPLTVSLGWALYPDDAQTIDDLVATADLCVRSVKVTGKNRVQAADELVPDSA